MLLGPGIVLSLILNLVTGFIQNHIINTVGQGWYLGLFGWMGTIVHELGHVIFCLIFWHKITEMQLFHPDPETGTLGYVKHSYNRSNIYQLFGNFFIGVGPILLGTAIIFLLFYWLLGLSSFYPDNFNIASSQLNSWNAFRELWLSLWKASGHLLSGIFSWQHLASWQLYLFLYLAFAIGSSITLSPPDIKAALAGLIVIVIIVFIFNLSTAWAGNFVSDLVISAAGYYACFYAIVFLILIINTAIALLVFLPLSLLRFSHSH